MTDYQYKELKNLVCSLLEAREAVSVAMERSRISSGALNEQLKKIYGFDPNEEDNPRKFVLEDPRPRMMGDATKYWILTYHTDTGSFDVELSS